MSFSCRHINDKAMLRNENSDTSDGLATYLFIGPRIPDPRSQHLIWQELGLLGRLQQDGVDKVRFSCDDMLTVDSLTSSSFFLASESITSRRPKHKITCSRHLGK